MSTKAKGRKDRTNSGSDEEKSEEFKNFEHAIDHMLSLPKEEVERIKREVPVKRKTSKATITRLLYETTQTRPRTPR
jgi:hypothetical protein